MTDHHESTKYDYDSPSSNPGLTKNKILEYTPTTSGFKAIMNIFYNDKVDGKFTMDIAGNPIRKINKEKMDNHHIYPKSRVDSLEKVILSKFNSIANIILLDNNTNREDIKDKAPLEYFSTINLSPKGSFNCEQNLIDIHEAIKIELEADAEKFIDDRAEKIAEIVNSYF